MKSNFASSLDKVLLHEGGFVNNPKDPGGATNKGVTIGTLKRLGIDVDGDGDSDIADLKALRRQDLELVYRKFYWDAVKGDMLPAGLDYAMFDFAVNSGPARAAQHLQRILGAEVDGDIGPKTLSKLDGASAAALVVALCDSRLRFMRQAKHPKTGELLWPTFGNGWQKRVDAVRVTSAQMANASNTPSKPIPAAPAPAPKGDLLTLISGIISRIFSKGA